MTAKRYRWSCPEKEHPGVLAPGRMLTNDVRRFCLPCSTATGFLVERTCAAIERKRETKAEQRKARAKRQRDAKRARQEARERESERARVKRKAALEERVGDLHAELIRIWPIVRACSPFTVACEPPVLRVRNRQGATSTGFAYHDKHEITVSVAAEDDVAGAVGVLAHECCHRATPRDCGHSPAFWRLLVDVAREAYGAEITHRSVDQEPDRFTKQEAIEASIRAARGYAPKDPSKRRRGGRTPRFESEPGEMETTPCL